MRVSYVLLSQLGNAMNAGWEPLIAMRIGNDNWCALWRRDQAAEVVQA
jgi:hypothetical protein